jgi:hypothetical protein
MLTKIVPVLQKFCTRDIITTSFVNGQKLVRSIKKKISQKQSSNFVPPNFNDVVDDGDYDIDDDNDGNNCSSIPSDFIASSSFILSPFVSSLPSRTIFPSVPSLPSTPFVPAVSTVFIISTVSTVSIISTVSSVPVVPAVSSVPKFQLTSDQAALVYSDLIGDVETE